MKILKVVLILLATALMAAVMIFVSDASVVDMMAGTYALSVNAFLGVDLAAMIKDSTAKPAGEWKSIKMYRYIISFVCMAVLFVLGLYQKEVNNVQAVMAISAFGSGTMLIIGLVMAGLEGNKIASRVEPKDGIPLSAGSTR